MNLRLASVVPKPAASIDEAGRLVVDEGAAMILDIADPDGVFEYGHRFLGENDANVEQQQFLDAAKVTEYGEYQEGPDERGRIRPKLSRHDVMPVHNDGRSFGEFAPNYLLLWSQHACAEYGDSVLIDAAKLLEIISEDPEHADLVDFCWNVPIDQSEAHRQLPDYSPIARRTPNGRVQVRAHTNMRAAPGPLADEHQAMVDRWLGFVYDAQTMADTFHLKQGEGAMVDNYRVLHGRLPYVDPERTLVQAWFWSKDAFALPTARLNLADVDPLAAQR